MTRTTTGCTRCQGLPALDFDFSMAFQPIIDLNKGHVWGYEALVRGMQGESAAQMLNQVDEHNRYRFDQACRVKAIELASQLKLEGILSINFLPNAVYEPKACLQTTLQAAQDYQFPVSRLQFEITEVERVRNHQHLRNIINTYHDYGMLTAIDDFGSGYANLDLLANFHPDVIKLDMSLVRGIDQDKRRTLLVDHMRQITHALGIQLLAEGIETEAEAIQLARLGVDLVQGFWFAKPGFESLPKAPERHMKIAHQQALD